MIPLPTRKRHDTAYPLVVELADANGARSLSDASTVKFTMTDLGSGAVKVLDGSCDILDQTTKPGQVSYQWIAINVDTTGTYKCEWEVVFVSGDKATWPSGDYAQLKIIDDLNAT